MSMDDWPSMKANGKGAARPGAAGAALGTPHADRPADVVAACLGHHHTVKIWILLFALMDTDDIHTEAFLNADLCNTFLSIVVKNGGGGECREVTLKGWKV